MTVARTRSDFELQRGDVAKLLDRLPPHSVEAEMSLIGSLILAGTQNIHLIGEVMQIISSEADFYRPKHAAIYKAVVDLYDQHQAVDTVPLTDLLRDRQQFEQIGGVDYLVELVESVPTSVNAPHYARIIRDKAKLRYLIDAAGHILRDAYETAEPANITLDKAERLIFEIAQEAQANEPTKLDELMTIAFENLQARQVDGRTITGVATGFHQLDEMLSGLQPSEMLIVAARPSMGKAQPLDAKVLTSLGWTAMGELSVGDELASVDGSPSRVAGIFPQGERQVYRVTLSDGRSTECCDEHLWRVHFRSWDDPHVLSTAELRQKLTRKRYQNRLWIEPFAGEFGDDERLPIDPWLLGFLIGDGCLTGGSVRFSTADDQMLQRVADSAGNAFEITHAGAYDYRLIQRGGARRTGVQGVSVNPITAALRELGLWGLGAEAKFVPPTYLRASRDSRERLLQGLIDSDGWVESFGSLRFATCSQRLAADVVNLMRSLGGSGGFTEKRTSFTHRGEQRDGRLSFVCNLQHPDAVRFASLDHKRQRLHAGRVRQRRLNIVSIEPTRVTQTQCIAVTHPEHLYVTDDYIVTHNTAFAINIAEYVAVDNQQPVAVFSLEMSKQQLAERMLSSRSGVDSQRIRRNMINGDELAQLQETADELSGAPMFIDDTPGLSILELRAKARRLASRSGIKAIVIDYLQLMSSPGAESRQNEVGEISRGVKALARELHVPVICLSQLNRNSEGRESKKPMLSDLRESGAIEQDADVVMMLHREEYYHKEEEWAHENPDKVGVAEIIIAKQRNGPTGIVPLQFDGSTTRFHNLARGVDTAAF